MIFRIVFLETTISADNPKCSKLQPYVMITKFIMPIFKYVTDMFPHSFGNRDLGVLAFHLYTPLPDLVPQPIALYFSQLDC